MKMKTERAEFRFFTVPEWEEEQEYLRRRHKEGWRFTYVRACRYHFEACPPQDVVYQLDFNPERQQQKSEYIQMFRDCGWEYLQDFVGYSYFRKPKSAMGERDEEIFCDDASRLDMMNHVLRQRILPLLAIFLCCILPQLFLQSRIGDTVNWVLTGIFAVIAVLYLILFLRFAWKYWALLNGRKRL